MALSSTDLDKIDAAIAQGALTLEFNGRRITYRSMDELLAARPTSLRSLCRLPPRERRDKALHVHHVAGRLMAKRNATNSPPKNRQRQRGKSAPTKEPTPKTVGGLDARARRRT